MPPTVSAPPKGGSGKPREIPLMKHLKTISHTPKPANSEIISVIGTVLSGLGALLLGIVPLLNKD